MSAQLDEKRVIRGACPQDCPDTCAMLYTVQGSRLIDVKGDPDHPITQGGLCIKLKDFAKRHYHPDRVLYPMKRVGPKGSGQFQRISWDDALLEIKTRWTAIIRDHGAKAIMPYSYLGTQGMLNGLTVGDPFFSRLGATTTERTFCGSGSSTAYVMTCGPSAGVDPESFPVSKFIVLWGINTMSTNLHHWRFILEAQKNGAKIVVIDPVRTRTAKQADWHIALRPGTDAAFALGVMNVVISEGLEDKDYIEKYTEGFDDLKKRAAEYPVERVASITGVPAETIRQFARKFATTQPAVIRMGIALERNRNGGQAVRAVSSLPALVGAWRHPGGGVLQLPLWAFPIRWDRMSRPDLIHADTRVINVLDLGRALTEQYDPPIKSLVVYNANPMSNSADTNRIAEGLRREDLFTVVSELFVTDTARYADIILPATMQAEQVDLMFSWGHSYFTYNHQAIPAPGEAVPNTELFRRLAHTMGFEGEDWVKSDEEMLAEFVDWTAPVMEGITLDSLKDEGWARLKTGDPLTRTPHREGGFPTPSGKCEFKSSMAANGDFVISVFRSLYDGQQSGAPVDPLPDYQPLHESVDSNPALGRRYPLNLIAPKSHGFISSQYANDSVQLQRQGRQTVLINPADAAARNIGDGQTVRVFNDRGSLQAVASITDDTMAGVVSASLGYWPSLAPGGAAVNSLSSPAYSNLGHAPTFSDILVQIEPA